MVAKIIITIMGLKMMNKKKSLPAILGKAEIKPKESPNATAMKNVPDDVIVRAIRQVLSKEKK